MSVELLKHRIVWMRGRRAKCLCEVILRLPKDLRNRPLPDDKVVDHLLDAYNRHIKF